jgi:hypothetical protein
MDPRYSHLADDPILLKPNNEESEDGLYQAHAGVEVVDRNNISGRPGSRILAEYRGIDSKIPFAFSDPQVVGDVRVGKNESDGDNYDKKSFPPVRRLTPITSFAPCEGERANVGRANQNQIPPERASDLLRAHKDSQLKRRLAANEEEQDRVDDADEDDKGRSDANCRQKENEEVGKYQPSTKRRNPPRSARGCSSRKRHASPPILPVTRGRAARPYRRKKGRVSRSVSPDHHPSQDVNPDLPNTCAAPPSAAPNTDIGLQIVGTLNLSAVGPHAVYALYFRLSDLCWPSQPPTADPKPAIENEMESNGECDVEKIVRKEWVLEDGGYEPRYLVRWKGWGKEHDEWHGLDDLENAMELVDAFDSKHPRSREPPRRKAQAKPRIARPDLHDEGPPQKRRRLTRSRTVGNGIRDT